VSYDRLRTTWAASAVAQENAEWRMQDLRFPTTPAAATRFDGPVTPIFFRSTSRAGSLAAPGQVENTELQKGTEQLFFFSSDIGFRQHLGRRTRSRAVRFLLSRPGHYHDASLSHRLMPRMNNKGKSLKIPGSDGE